VKGGEFMKSEVRNIIARHWRKNVHKVVKFGPVWKVKSKEGYFCFKRWKRRVPQLMFTYYAIEELWHRGYSGTPRIIPDVQGKPYAEDNGEIYILTKWVGRPLKEKSKREWVAAAKALAGFHHVSENITLPPGLGGSCFYGRWLYRFPKCLEEMRTLFYGFKNPRNIFEEEAVRNAPVILEVAESAYEMLLRSRYKYLSENLHMFPRLCHGNIKAKNFTVREEGGVCLVDSDSFRIDLPVQDLASFFFSALSSKEWSLSFARILFNAYDAVRPIEEDEIPILRALLIFPYDIAKYLEKYQEGGKTPEEFLRKWDKELVCFARQQYFFEQFFGI